MVRLGIVFFVSVWVLLGLSGCTQPYGASVINIDSGNLVSDHKPERVVQQPVVHKPRSKPISEHVSVPMPESKPIKREEKPKHHDVVVRKNKSQKVVYILPAKIADGERWQWPVRPVLPKYHVTENQGLNIQGKWHQKVYAASSGDVIYYGPGVRGYGNMLMVKQGRNYITVYANLAKPLVKQGESVTLGQAIALLGKDPKGQVLLHFEIRRNGVTIDTLSMLPMKKEIRS